MALVSFHPDLKEDEDEMISLSLLGFKASISQGKGPLPVAASLFTFEPASKPVCSQHPVTIHAHCHRLAQQGCSCWDHGWLPRRTTSTINDINPISSSTHLVQTRLPCCLNYVCLEKGSRALVRKLVHWAAKCLAVTFSQNPLVLEISERTGKRPIPYTIVCQAASGS